MWVKKFLQGVLQLLVALGFSYLATIAGDYVLIVFCSFVGALLAVYHIAYMFNFVDNFFDTIQNLEAGETMSGAHIVVLVLTIALACFGGYMQIKWYNAIQKGKDEDNPNEEELDENQENEV